MRIEQLEYFLTVARYGSLSQAAANLYVGQPTLSASIAGMEKELGKQLFVRTRRGMKLTAMGEDLLPMAERTVDAYYAMKKRAGTDASELSHLHLLTTGLGEAAMSDAVLHSKEVFPKVGFHIHRTYASEVLSALADRHAAIGLSWAMGASLSRHREYAKGAGLRLVALKSDALCFFATNHETSRYNGCDALSFDEAFQDAALFAPSDLIHQGAIKGHERRELQGAITVDSRSMLEAMVFDHDGLGITSKLAAETSPFFHAGLFRTIEMVDFPTEIVHYMAYLRDMQATDVEADIIQNIENYYDKYKGTPLV